jgi:hypothetical protein
MLAETMVLFRWGSDWVATTGFGALTLIAVAFMLGGPYRGGD